MSRVRKILVDIALVAFLCGVVVANNRMFAGDKEYSVPSGFGSRTTNRVAVVRGTCGILFSVWLLSVVLLKKHSYIAGYVAKHPQPYVLYILIALGFVMSATTLVTALMGRHLPNPP